MTSKAKEQRHGMGCQWRCQCVHESAIGNLNFVSCWSVSVYQTWWWLPLGLVCSDHESSESIIGSCWFELTPLSEIYTQPKQQNGDIVTSFMHCLLDAKHQEPLNVKSQNHRDFMASKPKLSFTKQNIFPTGHTTLHLSTVQFSCFYLLPPKYW